MKDNEKNKRRGENNIDRFLHDAMDKIMEEKWSKDTHYPPTYTISRKRDNWKIILLTITHAGYSFTDEIGYDTDLAEIAEYLYNCTM